MRGLKFIALKFSKYLKSVIFQRLLKSYAQSAVSLRTSFFHYSGSYTLNHLLPRLPSWCHKVVAVDNSEAMLEFARENNADPRIEYRTLDLMKDDDVVRLLLEQGPFQRVYSFFTLHWMADQHRALKNIDTLMAPGAECLLAFSDTLVVFDIFTAMMRSQRWQKYSQVSFCTYSGVQYSVPPFEAWKIIDSFTHKNWIPPGRTGKPLSNRQYNPANVAVKGLRNTTFGIFSICSYYKFVACGFRKRYLVLVICSWGKIYVFVRKV